jgi:hypothetical protein
MTKKENFFDTDELLNEVLKAEPGFTLSDNFADQIAKKVDTSFTWQQYIREFLLYLAVLLGIAGVVTGMSFLWFGLELEVAISFLLSNIPLISGILVLGVFILFADRVLLRFFMYRSSNEIR